MRILVDAVLFQLVPADANAAILCAGVLWELVEVADRRGMGLTILDRGGLPPLGRVEAIGFPSFHAADAVADATLLQRMAESVGASALVSTALTMPLLLPTVQLICGSEEAAVPGRAGPSELIECEIAVACSSMQVCASEEAEDAFRARFPGRRFAVRPPLEPGSGGTARDGQTAALLLDAAAEASSPFADADLARRFLALRRLQAAFEISDG